MNTSSSTQSATGPERPREVPAGEPADDGARTVRRILSRAGTAVADEGPPRSWTAADGGPEREADLGLPAARAVWVDVDDAAAGE